MFSYYYDWATSFIITFIMQCLIFLFRWNYLSWLPFCGGIRSHIFPVDSLHFAVEICYVIIYSCFTEVYLCTCYCLRHAVLAVTWLILLTCSTFCVIYFSACLRSWLEQDTSCPTCRTSLSDLHHSGDSVPANDTLPDHNEQVPAQNNRRRQRTTNRFHFDGTWCHKS
jgi:hypothetical protein